MYLLVALHVQRLRPNDKDILLFTNSTSLRLWKLPYLLEQRKQKLSGYRRRKMINSSYAQLVKILDYSYIIQKECIKSCTNKIHIKWGSRKKSGYFPETVFISLMVIEKTKYLMWQYLCVLRLYVKGKRMKNMCLYCYETR